MRRIKKANRIILEESENYTKWRSYILDKLQQRNCNWAITERLPPTKESLRRAAEKMGFSPAEITSQTIYTTLTIKLKEYQAALKKVEGVIKNSVAHKNQPNLKGKTAQEIWKILKTKFQHISSMSILRLILDTTKIQLSNCTDIHNYCGKYQEVYDAIYSVIGDKCELSSKGGQMLLHAGLLTGMGDKYSSLISTLESEWKEGETDLANSILRLIQFSNIQKENAKTANKASPSALLTASPSKPASHRAPPGTCTNQGCIDKGVTAHYTKRCFLKYPKLRAKYSLRGMKLRGSRPNLWKDIAPTQLSSSSTNPNTELTTQDLSRQRALKCLLDSRQRRRRTCLQ